MKLRTDRILNVGLRGITLGARFLFVFFLAKYMDPASVGYYGLFTAAVGYSIYFVGFDFYTYTTREILKIPADQRGMIIKNQVALSLGLYFVFLPLVFLVFQNGPLPTAIFYWFIPLLILEHLNQEVFRFLVALGEQVTASYLLFIRQGSWALLVVIIMAWLVNARNLQFVFSLYTLGGLIAAIVGIIKIAQFKMGGWQRKMDWRWIKNGLRVSLAFLVATLALRGVQTIDRYWLEALVGIETVGAYVLFMGVASTLLTFLDAGVFAFAYPELIKLKQTKQHESARQKTKEMLHYTLIFCVIFGLSSWVALPYLLEWIGNQFYTNNIAIYPWLLAAMIINAIGMVPHYALYASGRDRPIILSHVAALVVFVISTWLISDYDKLFAVPVALDVSFAVILVWKSVAYLLNQQAAQALNQSSQTV